MMVGRIANLPVVCNDGETNLECKFGARHYGNGYDFPIY